MNELYNTPKERPLNFKELYGDQVHLLSRTILNAKMLTMASVDRGISKLTRTDVPEDRAAWDVDYPEYNPPFVDIPRGESTFRKSGDMSDPGDPNEIPYFTSLEVNVVARDKNGRPLNPIGRTGLCGRGMLDKWGATLAADPILTRINPETQTVEVLLIKRGDTGDWALPGGKVDACEEPWQAAGRELIEEAGVNNVTIDFSQATPVYAGYVDDPRNTDNAWMETTAYHIHLNAIDAQNISIHAGSDATGAQWIPTTDERYAHLYAGQDKYIGIALARLQSLDMQ